MFSFQQINQTSKRLQIYNVRCSREIYDMGKGIYLCDYDYQITSSLGRVVVNWFFFSGMKNQISIAVVRPMK